jgi:site-specific recombinase XerD
VVAQDGSPWWVVTFPGAGVVHEPTRAWLRDLAACDCSPSTLRSYAYGLLRWLRFLWLLGVRWEQAERVHVGAFVAYLQQAANPLRARRSPTAPPLGSVNPITGKAYPGNGYARRTINHQLSALFSFYAFAVDADLGPLVNPVPAQRGYRGGRPHAHHSPMEEFALARPATYRQHVPRQVPRSIPDAAVDALFGALRTNRDRALVAFYLSSGARASELLGLQHDRIDVGRRTIKVVSKGSRALDEVPASRDAFVWLALYLAEGFVGHGATPVWWTLRAPRRPLSYHGMRAVLGRANAALGTNYSLHDLRHTAAARLAADPSFTLVEVQAILRHAHLSTTQLYLQPRLEELIERLTQHYAQQRRQAPLQVPVGYDQAVVAELLGLPQ